MVGAVRPLERALVVLTAAYVLAFLAFQTPGLTSRLVMEYDARTYYMGGLRMHHAGPFSDDLIAHLSRTIGPIGWDAMLWVWTLFADPVWLSKLLPFVLFALLCGYAFALGRRIGGAGLGCAFTIVLAHAPLVWATIAGGNPRAFGFVTVIAWLYYRVAERPRHALIVVAKAGLFYLPAFLVLCGAHALTVRRRRELVGLALVGAACTAAYVPKVIVNAREFGSNPTLAQTLGRPELGPGGAAPGWPMAPVWQPPAQQLIVPWTESGHGGVVGVWGGEVAVVIGVGLLLLVAIRERPRLRELPRPILLLPVAGIALYLVARLVAFKLHYPERYTQYSWVPFGALILPLLAWSALRRFAHAALWTGVGTAVFVFVLYGDGLNRGASLLDSRAAAPDVMSVLGKTAPETVIAAPMRFAEILPLAIHRRVWIKEGAINPLPGGEKWWHEIDRRVRTQFAAYYAQDLPPILALRDAGVGVLLVDVRDFGPNAVERAHLFEPWGSWMKQLAARGHFALEHPPASAILLRRDPWIVVDLHKL